MAIITCKDGTVDHFGTTYPSGTHVSGTLIQGSNAFCKINGVEIVVEDGTLVVPLHNYTPTNTHSHVFTPNTFFNSYFFIEGKKIVCIGDSYSSDITTVNSGGSNIFFDIL